MGMRISVSESKSLGANIRTQKEKKKARKGSTGVPVYFLVSLLQNVLPKSGVPYLPKEVFLCFSTTWLGLRPLSTWSTKARKWLSLPPAP